MAKAAKNKLASMIRTDVPYPASHKPTKQEQAERRRYQAEDALRTITRAEEIRRDRALMADVKKCARDQMNNLKSVTSSRKR